MLDGMESVTVLEPSGAVTQRPVVGESVRVAWTAEADFPENHHRSRGFFRVMVGWRLVMDDEGGDPPVSAGFGKPRPAWGPGFWEDPG